MYIFINIFSKEDELIIRVVMLGNLVDGEYKLKRNKIVCGFSM